MFGWSEGEDDDAADDEEDEEEDELTFAGSALIPAGEEVLVQLVLTSGRCVERALEPYLVAWVSSSTAPLTSVFICSTFQSTRSSKVP